MGEHPRLFDIRTKSYEPLLFVKFIKGRRSEHVHLPLFLFAYQFLTTFLFNFFFFRFMIILRQ